MKKLFPFFASSHRNLLLAFASIGVFSLVGLLIWQAKIGTPGDQTARVATEQPEVLPGSLNSAVAQPSEPIVPPAIDPNGNIFLSENAYNGLPIQPRRLSENARTSRIENETSNRRTEELGEKEDGAKGDEDEESDLVVTRKGKEYRIKNEIGERFDKPDEAMEYYLQQRLPAGETQLPVERYFEAREKIRQMGQYSTAEGKVLPSDEERGIGSADSPNAPDFTWSNIGPGNVGGRTRALVIDPTDANVMFAAGVAGGIWCQTNAGTNWTPLDDFMANLAVTSISMDPTNSQILYAGTGEGFFNADGVRGAGIFKTTNGGNRRGLGPAATNTADFFFVNKVVKSPANSTYIYAATRTEVHRSLDSGTT